MTQMEELHLHSLARSEPAQKLPLNISRYPKLEKNQAGHIRHFHNLTAQLDGEWHHMGIQEPGQEFLDALRYQLATMAYATGAAHYHHLPLLRSVFKPLIRKLIYKMLRREVWGYWFNTSLSGSRVDPSLKELRKPWADPVIKENIMYSGHLLLMTSLYAMLFDDDEFEKPGSLSFLWDPIFFGFGTERYEYNNASLQNVILKEMEANGWMGVCCEPNLVFVVCNQFPMIAMRYNDVRHGTKTIDEVLPKYKAAWAKKSMVGSNGQIVNNWMVKQDNINPSLDLGFSAWTNAFMNTWNSEFVYATYASQSLGFIVPTPDNNQYAPLPSRQAIAFRNLVTTENADPKDPLTLAKAKEIAAQNPLSKFPYNAPQLGYICKWLSELGKTNELKGLLAYIDTHLDPTWENGGLFYPRHDKLTDEEGNWTHMDPFSGNAAIGYARLNVKDGQKSMWERPWTRQEAARRPYVECRGLESGVDFFRGAWDGGEEACVVTMRSWDGRRVAMGLQVRQLERGDWAVYVDGELRGVQSVQAGESVKVDVDVGGEKVDVVVMKCRS